MASNKGTCKYENDPPHQEKFEQEGAPYPTNALPIEDPNITDRAIDIRTPYRGSFNPNVGQFMHTASEYMDDAAREAAAKLTTGIILHITPKK